MHEDIHRLHVAPNLSLLQDHVHVSAEVFQERTPIQTHRKALSAPPRKNMPSAQWLVDLSAPQEAKVLIPWQLGSPESKNPYGM